MKQLNALESEQPKALLGLSLEIRWPAIASPKSWPGPRQPGFCRNDEVARVRVERLMDNPLAHLGTVRISGVDERHAQLDGAAKYANHLVVIAWGSPHSWSG